VREVALRPRTRQRSTIRRHAPERQAGGAEPDDFPVRAIRIAANDVDGIGNGLGSVVLDVEGVEGGFQAVAPDRRRDGPGPHARATVGPKAEAPGTWSFT